MYELYDKNGNQIGYRMTKRIKNEDVMRDATDIKIDVRNLSPGMYLLNPVKDGERKQSIKFIKK